MIYLSKGIVQKNSTEQLLYVLHGGRKHELTVTEAAMWLNGRFGFSKTKCLKEAYAVANLESLGLVELEKEDGMVNRYRIATRCVFCPAEAKRTPFLKDLDATILHWLKYAGIRLSVAELVCLFEYGVKPTKDLLYPENRQRLIESIYTKETIEDNLLESLMEEADCRDEIVEGLMRLLKKKQIIVL